LEEDKRGNLRLKKSYINCPTEKKRIKGRGMFGAEGKRGGFNHPAPSKGTAERHRILKTGER